MKRNYLKACTPAALAILVCGQGDAQNAAPSANSATSELKLLSPLPPAPPNSERPPSDPRNFEGLWYIAVAAGPTIRQGNREMPPFTPEKAKREQYKREMNDKGMPVAGLSGTCRPPPRAALNLGADQFPAEIVQTPNEVIVLNEELRGRWQIFINGQHPKPLQPSYFGDSIGHWEGDTLVVETVGFNGKDDNVSTQARIVSRLRKLNGGKEIELKQTTTDPLTYTRPVESARTSSWNPTLQMLEFQCEENIRATKIGLVHEGAANEAPTESKPR